MMSPTRPSLVRMPFSARHPLGIVAVLYPRHPFVVVPSNSSRHPAARSDADNVLADPSVDTFGVTTVEDELPLPFLAHATPTAARRRSRLDRIWDRLWKRLPRSAPPSASIGLIPAESM